MVAPIQSARQKASDKPFPILLILWILSKCVFLAGCHPTPATPKTGPATKPGGQAVLGPFRDIGEQAGLRFRHDPGAAGQFRFVETTAGGCAFLDYDRDGKLDFFLVQSGPVPGTSAPGKRPLCALYHNEGTATAPRFRDVAAEAGLDQDFGYVQGVAVADYDNDGDPDLYLTAYGGNHLLRNEAGVRRKAQGVSSPPERDSRLTPHASRLFRDVTAQAGVGDADQGPRWATSAAWGDYDADGRLDLYVCHYCRWTPQTDVPCVNRAGQRTYCTPTQYEPDVGRLYRNRGNGRFQDVTHAARLDSVRGRGLGALWLDYNGDRRLDLYVANDLNPNLLFRNRGNGVFEESGLTTGVAYGSDGQALSGMGIAAADYDGDGREDLYVTNFSGQTNSLFRSAGQEEFRYSTQSAGLAGPTYPFLAFGVSFLDYDNDGNPDLVLGNGHVNPDIDQMGIGVTYAEPKGLFHNRGDGTFEDRSASSGDMLHPRVTRGLAAGDFNNDGRPDVLVNNLAGPAELFQNVDAAPGHFITLRLVGVRSNRDGIGAQARVTAGGRTRLAVSRASCSYLSSQDPRLHIGLGAVGRVDRLEVLWPSGQRDVYRNVPADHGYVVTEGKGYAREW